MEVYILEHGEAYEGTYGTWVFAKGELATKRLQAIAKEQGDHNPKFESRPDGLSYSPGGRYGEYWCITEHKVIDR